MQLKQLLALAIKREFPRRQIELLTYHCQVTINTHCAMAANSIMHVTQMCFYCDLVIVS